MSGTTRMYWNEVASAPIMNEETSAAATRRMISTHKGAAELVAREGEGVPDIVGGIVQNVRVVESAEEDECCTDADEDGRD